MCNSSISIDKIIRSKRKSIALIVGIDGSLIVRAPYKTTSKQIEAFVKEKEGWIRSKKEIATKLPRYKPKEFMPGEEFIYLGEIYTLVLVDEQSEPLVLSEHFLLLRSVVLNAKEVFTQWYKNQAKQVITARVNIFAEKYDFEYKRINITSAKTRWGSCSSKGSLNFTWRLVMAPQDVIDYVIVHELAHLKINNHSMEYWRELEQIMPDYRDRKNWLNDNGQLLNL